MPTTTELRAYAQRLPEIYRDILAAFPAIEPGRRAGYGVAFQTLAMHFANTRRRHAFDDVQEACARLAEAGFLEIRHGIFAHPTELGEELIAAVTGSSATTAEPLPQLPALTW